MADLAGAVAAFEAPPPGSALGDAPQLRLGAYEGPLDLLLDLARAQRVDLTRISVVALVEQFIAAMETAIAARRVPLAAIGDWLVTAATLLALRARLLLPPSSAEAREAEREAAALRRQLASRAQVQAGAAWLERRPQLGREVFGRGARLPEAAGPPVADVTELLRACLRLLQLSPRERVYRPHPPRSGACRTRSTTSGACSTGFRERGWHSPAWCRSVTTASARPCSAGRHSPAPPWPCLSWPGRAKSCCIRRAPSGR